MHVFKIYLANYLNNLLICFFSRATFGLSFFQHYFRAFNTPAAARVFHASVVCGASKTVENMFFSRYKHLKWITILMLLNPFVPKLI